MGSWGEMDSPGRDRVKLALGAAGLAYLAYQFGRRGSVAPTKPDPADADSCPNEAADAAPEGSRSRSSSSSSSSSSAAPAPGESEPVVIGHQHTIHSSVLGHDRQILVHTPFRYEEECDPQQFPHGYPVLYVLDGSSHFHFISGLVHSLGMMDKIPRHIVVGIPPQNRFSESTPAASSPDSVDTDGTNLTERYPSAGRADEFAQFLKQELIPHIDSTYHTSSFRTVMGHSLTGLLVLHIWLHLSDLFGGYIAASPSLSWDSQHLALQAGNTMRQKITQEIAD